MSEAGEPWYAGGLRFTCTQCGNCCGGGPGNVYCNEDELDALAQRLGMDREAFDRRYTKTVYRNGREWVSLEEQANYDCVFYHRERGCTVYEDRPLQCRTWPFWRANLVDREEWHATAEDCPGMNHGELHDAAAITATAEDDGLP